MNYYNYANFFIGLLPLAWEKVCFTCNILLRWDHSHLRGKKHSIFPLSFVLIGSLPLTWEKGGMTWSHVEQDRITPTYVGKRRFALEHQAELEDHSHLRGKKTQCFQAKLAISDHFIMKFFTTNSLNFCPFFCSYHFIHI